MTNRSRAFAALLALAACRAAPPEPVAAPAPPVFANVCESDDPLSHCDKSDPVVCRAASDCPVPSCGPCGAGDIVTQRDLSLDCGVSACSSAIATTCSPDHVCRVR